MPGLPVTLVTPPPARKNCLASAGHVQKHRGALAHVPRCALAASGAPPRTALPDVDDQTGQSIRIVLKQATTRRHHCAIMIILKRAATHHHHSSVPVMLVTPALPLVFRDDQGPGLLAQGLLTKARNAAGFPKPEP